MIITFKIESKPETSDRPIEAQIRPIWAGKMKFGWTHHPSRGYPENEIDFIHNTIFLGIEFLG
jgi:hypothetical protein